MNAQPEALRLADLLDTDGWPDAAAELRRLYNLLMDQQREIHGLNMARSMEQKTAALKQAALLKALKWIADHDLLGTDLMVAGHMARGFIGRARAAVSAFEGEKT